MKLDTLTLGDFLRSMLYMRKLEAVYSISLESTKDICSRIVTD